MSFNWRKMEDENGFPYYVNETTKNRQWDHPEFCKIKQQLDECNYVKHSKYRVALKFRILQQTLYMEDVPLSIISGVFERHRLGSNENSLCLEGYDLEAVLSDIYFAANKQNNTNIDIDFATELMENFLFNVYDREREGKIQVFHTKLILAILSNCQLHEIHNFLFKLCADHNNCITRLRLQSLLLKLVDIFIFFHEDVSFGQHLVNSTIEACFSNNPGLVGVTECHFMDWLEKEPLLISWLPILYRIKLAEAVIHSGKCSTCKISPLLGLRYRCIKCTRFTQCQRCFFTGKTNNSHKLSHSMREYCTSTETNRDLGLNFVKKICALLSCSIKLNETNNNITVVDTKYSDNNFFSKSTTTTSNNDNDTIKTIESLSSSSSPYSQLQLIIKQLECENRQLQHILTLGNYNEIEIKKYLEQHRLHVTTQIEKLKILKNYLVQSSNDDQKQQKPFESTPMVKFNNVQSKKTNNFDMLSPIGQAREDDSTNPKDHTQESLPYSVNDISTWLGGGPNAMSKVVRKSPVRELHNDLDDALAKLQQILANNFSLDESLGNIDNNHLKHAVSEVEGMLTSIIDNVESSRSSSTQPAYNNDFNQKTELLSEKF